MLELERYGNTCQFQQIQNRQHFNALYARFSAMLEIYGRLDCESDCAAC